MLVSPLRLSPEESALLHAQVLVQGYSLGLAQVAERSLGDLGTDRADIRLLLVVGSADGVSPSEVVATLGRPRSTVSRGLARLLSTGLVARRTSAVDRRRAELYLSAPGRAAAGPPEGATGRRGRARRPADR